MYSQRKEETIILVMGVLVHHTVDTVSMVQRVHFLDHIVRRGTEHRYIPNYDKLSYYIRDSLPRVTVKMLGCPVPNSKQFTIVNSAQSFMRKTF